LLGRDITVYGDGSQTRSFCYVDDLVDALIRLMATTGDVTGPINVGNPSEFSIMELATQVIGLVGSRSRVVHRPLQENDPKQRQPDISLAQDLLAWSPHTPLKAGLISTIAYFDQLLADQSLREQLAASQQ
jgi:UDP-glucuronate decarboxylase